MSVLSRRSSFWTAAAVAGVTLWASAASSTNYPLYAAQWRLAAWVPTAIFATYPIVLIPMLLIFGNLSDYIGRRKAILLGLGAVSAGALLLGVARISPWSSPAGRCWA
jgi:MFS family permease